jgi:hypothetical protein
VEVLAMKIRDVGMCLFGSAMVYVAMAACSSGFGSSHGNASSASGAGGGVQATAGGPGGSGSGHDSGVVDALTNPVPSAKADPVDGTRLKAEYITASDGSKEYIDGVWYDSQRSEVCAFTTAGDGQNRCLPSGVTATGFSDAMCTQPLLALTSGCAMPAYVLTTTTSTCGGAPGTNVYAVGASTTPTALYLQNGTSCYQAGAPGSGFSYYTAGAEVAPTSFVAATTGHD